MRLLTSTLLAASLAVAGIAAAAISAVGPAAALPLGAAGGSVTAPEAALVLVQHPDRSKRPQGGSNRNRGNQNAGQRPGGGGNHNAGNRPGGGNHGHRPNNNHHHRGNSNRDAAIAAGVLGIVGGLMIAGAAQQQPAWPRHCYRLNDFDPRDGSYIDHRGRLRYCR